MRLYLRSKLLYTLYPYDKSIFLTMYNPWWVVLLLCSTFPFYGVQAVYYWIVFLSIDKRDEYQLVTFALELKVSAATPP